MLPYFAECPGLQHLASPPTLTSLPSHSWRAAVWYSIHTFRTAGMRYEHWMFLNVLSLIHIMFMLLKSWRAFDAPVNKMLPATSKFPAGSLEVNGWLPQLYSIPQASQDDNMRTNVPSLLLIITLHCSWQLLHEDSSSFRQLSYTMYFLFRWTTSSWWSVISLKNIINNFTNYL